MAWESRAETSRRYYYQSSRGKDGRVVKVYCGSGKQAEAAAAQLALSKARREADRQAVQEERTRLAPPDTLTEELVALAHLLLESALLTSGFHRGTNCGPWRKRRGRKE
jgi:hypothetical protein